MPFQMRLGKFRSSGGEELDEIMVVHMPEGKSYTGSEQVELFCHGGRVVVNLILQELLKAGARAAEPGEFTKLAFLNGRIDLARAEAVAELIAADTETSFRAAREHLFGAYSEHVDQIRDDILTIMADIEADIDFAEETVDAATVQKKISAFDDLLTKIDYLLQSYGGGKIIREGYRIAIAGRPNVGKSSLFNLLLRQERALVHTDAGTTRDYLSEWIDLDGFAVNLIDTAGIRKGGGEVERQGRRRSESLIRDADLILWIVDLSQKDWGKALQRDLKSCARAPMLLVGNKMDLVGGGSERTLGEPPVDCRISCLTGRGINRLKKLLLNRVKETVHDLTSGHIVTSARHQQKLSQSARSLRQGRRKMMIGESPELIAFDLRQAASALEEITGRVYTEDLLGRIFSRFCIGK